MNHSTNLWGGEFFFNFFTLSPNMVLMNLKVLTIFTWTPLCTLNSHFEKACFYLFQSLMAAVNIWPCKVCGSRVGRSSRSNTYIWVLKWILRIYTPIYFLLVNTIKKATRSVEEDDNLHFDFLFNSNFGHREWIIYTTWQLLTWLRQFPDRSDNKNKIIFTLRGVNFYAGPKVDP